MTGGVLALVLGFLASGAAWARPMAPAPKPSAPMTDAPALASHRAVYDVSLMRATQQDGVRSAFGSTTYTLTDRCTGYTSESSLHLQLGMSNGTESTIEQRYVAWESKDNHTATFRMLTNENGALRQSYHGMVTLDATGAGSATYIFSGDKRTSFALPAGTLLPTAHMVALLHNAAKGDTVINRTVIDGSFDDGPYRIAGVIGRSVPDALSAAQTNPLESGPLASFALAYFPLNSNDDAPQYELTMNVYPNGIARHMVQDFGGFTLAFDLVRVEPVEKPPC